MDPRLLQYYSRELQHLREIGGEFASEFPKIAGRLGLDSFECADPYVERLLEGFAFLAARVQLKIDSEFPQFTQHMLEIVYPHYLAPTPSMAVVQFQPEPSEGSLEAGFLVPRGTVMRSQLGKDEQTPCEYRSAHDVMLWPIEVSEAEYFTGKEPVAFLEIPQLNRVRAGIRIQLRTTIPGMAFERLPLDSLPFFLHGGDELPMHLYEQLFAHVLAMVIRPTQRPAAWDDVVYERPRIGRLGFSDEQALLPYTAPSFQGYRLLHEYFAFPSRYLFAELTDLNRAFEQCEDGELDILLLLSEIDPLLENSLNASHFSLYCSPAINLFPKRMDRIHLTDRAAEHHVVPDRTRPMDFEIYQLNRVAGIGADADKEQEFRPFYAADDLTYPDENKAYYTVNRMPRLLSAKQRRRGPRSSYLGSETYLALVDGNQAPYRGELRQLSLAALCTNRDLPLQIPIGLGETDFTLESGAPVRAIRCLAGLTKPKHSHAQAETAWRIISHLSLNYLSLLDQDERQGAVALRELLSLYGDLADAPVRKQIEGVLSVVSKPITRRAPAPGPIAFARGLEVTVTLDENSFEGSGIFLLGAVLEQFFAKYVSLNSFTETVIKSNERGEVIRWPPRIGRRHLL